MVLPRSTDVEAFLLCMCNHMRISVFEILISLP